MRLRTLCLFISVNIFLLQDLCAQVIPDSLRVDWSQAGYNGIIPNPNLIINVKTFGAFGDSVHDDYTAIMKAINSSKLFRVIYFPAGNYLIKSSIQLPSNVVLRGDGISSNLIFDLSNSTQKDAIRIISKQTNSFILIDSGYSRKSTTLKISNTLAFAANSYAEIQEANGSWDTKPASWAKYCVGQMVAVTAVNKNLLTINPALRIDYTASLSPEIRIITTKRNVGIECLKITRIDTIIGGKYGSDVHFAYAVNCWVTGVEFNKSQAAHIMMKSSKNITVSGCYIHDAFTYDGTETAGYGILMVQHNSDCKVENSIFKHLRHAMIVKQGANGNIFDYNYSLDEYRSEFPHNGGADILAHGHFAFANLFEGNICQTIMIDNTWGPTGPYNIFLRNRAELYGIAISSNSYPSNNQSIVGNEVTSTSNGHYSIYGNQFTYDNNILGKIQPSGTNNLNDSSYYFKSKPYFWNINSSWPSIGGSNVLNSGSIPAKDRYYSANTITTCEKQTTLSNIKMTHLSNINEVDFIVSPNPLMNVLHVELFGYMGNVSILLMSFNGKVIKEEKLRMTNVKYARQQMNVDDIASGIYLLVVVDENGNTKTRKVIVAH